MYAFNLRRQANGGVFLQAFDDQLNRASGCIPPRIRKIIGRLSIKNRVSRVGTEASAIIHLRQLLRRAMVKSTRPDPTRPDENVPLIGSLVARALAPPRDTLLLLHHPASFQSKGSRYRRRFKRLANRYFKINEPVSTRENR